MLKRELDNNKLAVIDLGSNTFHLLVVEKHYQEPPYFNVIFRLREFVYILGKKHKSIGKEEEKRGLECIQKFNNVIHYYSIHNVLVAATAAFRMAKNGDAILKKFESILKHKIQIFSGSQEAEFIYKGIRLMPVEFEQANLIMDIGGGSVELILFKKNKIISAQSFNIGISFLRNNLRLSEPVGEKELRDLSHFLKEKIGHFISSIHTYKPVQLIGSSGPFEILEKLTSKKSSIKGNIFCKHQVLEIAQNIIAKSKQERLAITHMPSNRADLSKESFLLMTFILENIQSIDTVMVSPFSMKEGIISDQLNLA